MFIGMIIFKPLGLNNVSLIAATFPVLALIGLFFVKESPIHSARYLYLITKQIDNL